MEGGLRRERLPVPIAKMASWVRAEPAGHGNGGEPVGRPLKPCTASGGARRRIGQFGIARSRGWGGRTHFSPPGFPGERYHLRVVEGQGAGAAFSFFGSEVRRGEMRRPLRARVDPRELPS